MAVVNPMTPMLNPSAKDSRWLTLEVCREYQRNKCTRTDNECKFAHPPAHVEVQNGRVIACFDSIKGKCQRKDPPCKYLHPPQHLREQLLQNGRNNLILKSLQYQALQQQVLPSIIPMAPHYISTVPTTAVPQFSPYGLPAMPVQGGAADGTMVTPQVQGVIPTPLPAKAPTRPDRLERMSDSGEAACEPPLSDTFLAGSQQQSQIGLVPPYKRVAVETSGIGKSGIPVYQPALPAAYHQAATLMQLQQQPYIPAVTYNGDVMSAAYPNYLQQVTGHPPTVPRF